ncbi:8-oxo-dGTP diphosphatase MutT [Cohnella endophytica]|uniref:8-oxo-dGTP diphosphatase n=1 Tax=Cohnella endophytica TaxID=2419778 RepID=A0A494XGH2_9BACL|nr:8-oxo-dGTP diphosphatase MutT [Cohnella endophytica]RKP49835.1 8-oxo-dGTP diphosphatase MutT [Cohnella endophytica]
MKKVDVVGAVIYNENNEILCALRAMNMSLGGLWEFPGGKIEPGESPEETLVREIQEELGCKIEVHDFIADTTHEYPNVIVRLMTYKSKIIEGIPVPTEHERLEWLPLEKLRSLDWAPADLPTINELEKQSLK